VARHGASTLVRDFLWDRAGAVYQSDPQQQGDRSKRRVIPGQGLPEITGNLEAERSPMSGKAFVGCSSALEDLVPDPVQAAVARTVS